MYGGRRFIDRINECQDCGFRFVQRPTPGDEYYANADHSDYRSLGAARMRYFAEVKAELQKRRLARSGNESMLDLGAGDGDWLAVWPEIRFRYGTEMHPTLIQRMRERGISSTSALESLVDQRFELISAFDFLEHVEEPEQLLQWMRDRLVDGGSVIIGVPDMGKWAARLFGTRYYLYCPMHYSYFTGNSLRLLLSRYFSQVQIFRSPPMRTTLNAVAKWIFPRLQNAALDKAWLPMGYCASLIAVAQKPS